MEIRRQHVVSHRIEPSRGCPGGTGRQAVPGWNRGEIYAQAESWRCRLREPGGRGHRSRAPPVVRSPWPQAATRWDRLLQV